MNVYVEGVEWTVSFVLSKDPHGTRTTLAKVGHFIGHAVCKPEDHFRHDVGRLIALKMATAGWSRQAQRELLRALALRGVRLRALPRPRGSKRFSYGALVGAKAVRPERA